MLNLTKTILTKKQKNKVEAIMGSVRSVVNRPEIQKLLILSEAQKNEKNEVF